MNDWKFSRYSMYTSIQSVVNKLTDINNVTFIGEDGTSGLLSMFTGNVNITTTNYPAVNIMDLPYSDNSKQCLVIDQVLEHVRDPWKSVSEVYRVLTPGGIMILTTCLMNPVHYASQEDEQNGTVNDFWRFTPHGLEVLCDGFSSIIQCAGGGDFKFIYNCMTGMRHKTVHPGSQLESLAMADDGKHYLHVWVVARK